MVTDTAVCMYVVVVENICLDSGSVDIHNLVKRNFHLGISTL